MLTTEQAKTIADYLKRQFPWLGEPEGDAVSGADVINDLEDCYRALRDVRILSDAEFRDAMRERLPDFEFGPHGQPVNEQMEIRTEITPLHGGQVIYPGPEEDELERARRRA